MICDMYYLTRISVARAVKTDLYFYFKYPKQLLIMLNITINFYHSILHVPVYAEENSYI